MVVLSCFTGATGVCSFSSFVAVLEHAAIPSLSFISPELFSLWFLPHCLITKTSHQNEKNKYLWSSHKQHHPPWGEVLGELQLSRLEEEIKSCFLFAIASPSCFLFFMFSPCTSPNFSGPVLRLVPMNSDENQAELSPWVFICPWRGCEAPILWFGVSPCPRTAVWAGHIPWHVICTWWSWMQPPHPHYWEGRT